MQKAAFEKPLADWPETRILSDKGGVAFSGRYRPLNSSGPAFYTVGLIAIVLGLLLWGLTGFSGETFMAAVAVVAAVNVVGLLVVMPLAALFYRKKLRLKIFPESIEVNGKSYSRGVPIEFRVEQHHKAAAQEQRERRTGQRSSALWREAVEVVMQYGERRIVVAEMRHADIEKARALTFRLQDWSDKFDQVLERFRSGQELRSQRASGDFGPVQELR